MRNSEALIVQDQLASAILELIQNSLSLAGYGPARILYDVPQEIPEGTFLILDEQVGGSNAEELLNRFEQPNDFGVCVLVSSPYVEKVTRLKFGPRGLADIFIIKGPPDKPGHLDMFITSTIEPLAIQALFKRMRKSLVAEE